MIRITVATCTYNAQSTLGRTLDSVLHQTYREVEHLIIDGASTDGTLAMAEEYKLKSDSAECYHDVIIVSEPDQGLYYAMNKALTHATGDYIVFLNAGDMLPSVDTLENISASIGEGEELPAVIYGDTDIVDGEQHFVRHRRLSPPEELTANSFLHGMLVCHQAFYARTDIARATPYDTRYRFSADFDWCVRIMKKAEREHLKMKNTGMVLANYLDGGMTEKNHRASLRERFVIMCRRFGIIRTIAFHAWFVVRLATKK